MMPTFDQLFGALGKNEIWPALQPIVHLESGRLHAFELLARWSSPRLGNVSPQAFIPLAEANGYLSKVTLHLIKAVFPFMKDWPISTKLAINLSPRQLIEDSLLDQIKILMKANGVSPQQLQFELTEEEHLGSSDLIKKIIMQMKLEGFTFAIDDFGIGFSSLSRLHAIPFNEVKIDASFVSQIEKNPKSLPIVQWVSSLGKSLGMQVVAEGIETKEQLAAVMAVGCEYGQGFLLGIPVTVQMATSRAHGLRGSGRREKEKTLAEYVRRTNAWTLERTKSVRMS